jgi:hypothetical protein
MGLNPLQLMKLFGMNKKFQKNHPKVHAFFRTHFAGGLTEGTVLEISVTKPGEETVSTNMRVLKSDLDLIEELKKMK